MGGGYWVEALFRKNRDLMNQDFKNLESGKVSLGIKSKGAA